MKTKEEVNGIVFKEADGSVSLLYVKDYKIRNPAKLNFMVHNCPPLDNMEWDEVSIISHNMKEGSFKEELDGRKMGNLQFTILATSKVPKNVIELEQSEALALLDQEIHVLWENEKI